MKLAKLYRFCRQHRQAQVCGLSWVCGVQTCSRAIFRTDAIFNIPMLDWKAAILVLSFTTCSLIFGSAFSICCAQSLRPAEKSNQAELGEPQKHQLPNELKTSTMINRRYQEMLQKNQRGSNGGSRNQVFPGSYEINGKAPRYVRKQLPSRLIPPGRSNPQVSPYKLNRNADRAASTIKVNPQPVRDTINGNVDSSQRINRSIRQPNANPNTVLPPIVRPPARHSNLSRPIFFSNVNPKPVPQQRQPVIQTSQPTDSGTIQGMSRIPVSPVDSSKVTRARILFTQDPADPFGQVQDSSSQASNSVQDDPFADPTLNEQQERSNQNTDPFADPPGNSQPENQQDPFADPPEDFVPQNNQSDPFGDPPRIDPQPQMQQSDPVSNTPIEMDPNLISDPNLQQPETASPDPVDPGLAPGEPERANPQRDPDLILGPFESRPGFQPTPILPVPPHREFPNAALDSLPNSLGPSFHNQAPYHDQPSYFGSSFDKSSLYEGITEQPVEPAQYCESIPCTPNQFARPRLFNRLCRNSQCFVPDCTGCVPNAGYQPCDIGVCCDDGWIKQGNCSAEWGECCDSCFEPMFYLSLFGGYTQLENIGPFGVPNNIIADSPNATVMFNDGFGLGLALGQYQGPNLRSELEFSYRNNDADSILESAFTTNTFEIDGSVQSFSGMFNMLWDLQPRPIFGCYQPYVGAGIGFSFVDVDLPENSVIEDNENQSSFAYQIITGVSRPISFQTEGFVEYRYLNADPIRVLASLSAGNGEYATDNVFFGLRMKF